MAKKSPRGGLVGNPKGVPPRVVILTGGSPCQFHLEEAVPMLSARQAMDVVSVFRDVGSYRAAGAICGVDPKTVKRKVAAQESGELDQGVTRRRREVARNTDVVRDLVAKRVSDTKGTISAKRLLGEARAGGMGGRIGTSGGW